MLCIQTCLLVYGLHSQSQGAKIRGPAGREVAVHSAGKARRIHRLVSFRNPCLYMKWQFHEYKCGRISKRKLGGWGWSLPKKSSTGQPAELPSAVTEFLSGDGKQQGKKKRRHSESSSASSQRSSRSSRSKGKGKPQYKLDFWSNSLNF